MGRAGYELPVLRLEERVTNYLYSDCKNGLRITCTLTGRAGYGLPVLLLEERVTNYLYLDWKSGLRITYTLTGRAGYGVRVPRSGIGAQSAMLPRSEREAKGKIKDGH